MDAKATKLPAHDKFYIGGEWVDPAPGYQTQQVINPSTEESSPRYRSVRPRMSIARSRRHEKASTFGRGAT